MSLPVYVKNLGTVTELSYDIDQFHTLRSPILGKGIRYSRGDTIIYFSAPKQLQLDLDQAFSILKSRVSIIAIRKDLDY